MMRILLKLTLVAGLTVGGMSWLASSHGKNPSAFLSALDWQMPSGISAPHIELPELPRLGNPATTTVYRWTDTTGQVNLSTSPPPDGIPFTQQRIDPNTNLLPAVQLSTSAVRESTPSAERDAKRRENLPNVPQLTDLRGRLDAVHNANEQRTEHLNHQLQRQLD